MSSRDNRPASSSGSQTSSRNKTTYTSFNPRLPADAYKTENLERFILSAGTEVYERYKFALEVEKKRLIDEYIRSRGTNPNQYDGVNVTSLSGQALIDYNNWKKQDTALKQELTRSGNYRNALRDFRYNMVQNLHRDGLLRDTDQISQVEAVSAGLSREYTKADVLAKMNLLGRERFIEWIGQQTPAGFKTNALEEAAAQLKVPRTTTGIGLVKKTNLYNIIMARTGGSSVASMGGNGTPNRGVDARIVDELQRRNIQSTSQLSAMRSDDLKELAKQYDVQRSGKKSDIINSIATSAGMSAMRDRVQIESDIDAIIRLAAVDPGQAREQGRYLDANELTQVPLIKMRQLASAISLRKEFPVLPGGRRIGAPSRELIIATLTGNRTERSRSRENRESIMSNVQDCNSASMSTVLKIAQDLRIPSLGLTQEQLCDKIYAAHLARISELIVRRGGEIENIATLNGQAQVDEVKRLANTLKLGSNITTLDDLIRKWLMSHYQARAISLYPQRQQDVMNYLSDGALPRGADALRDLSVVFSDVRRDMYNMSDQDRRAALQGLYDQFINRLSLGGRSASGTFLANLQRYGFGTYQQGSPNRQMGNIPSPQMSPNRQMGNASVSPVRFGNSSPAMQNNAGDNYDDLLGYTGRSYNGGMDVNNLSNQVSTLNMNSVSPAGSLSPRSPRSNGSLSPRSPRSNRSPTTNGNVFDSEFIL